MPPRLMIPGPVELEPAVLEVMAQPAVAHYGDEWVCVHNETIALLKTVFAASGRVYMLPGSGSLALDAAAHSAFLPGETVIVANNGWFGERITDIMRANGVRIVPVNADPREPISAAAIADALDAHPEASGVAVVHLETSTGILNPIQEIAAVVRASGGDRLLMVDAVTGLTGAPLQTDAWGVDLCVSASQKALGGPAGLGLVALSDRAWAKIAARPDAPRSWYLDLRRWEHFAHEWADWHPFPVTMPTAVVLGLRAALRSLIAEGIDARMARYQRMARLLRDGLIELGMPLFADERVMAPTITAAFCPEGVSSHAVRDYILHHQNILITSGFGAYKNQVIRVGHMGGALDENDIQRLLDGLIAFRAKAAARAV